jgi:CHAD domain-containing protein
VARGQQPAVKRPRRSGRAAAAPRRRPRALRGREPAEAVRIVAQGLLAAAEGAAARLAEPTDAEALHDFRVAMRRLRSWLRSFRAEVSDTVGGKLRRKLKAVVELTGAGRDAEVLRALLAAERPGLAAAHRRAADALGERIAAGAPDPRAEAATAFAAVAPALAKALSRYQREVGRGRRARFGDLAGAAVRGQGEALAAALLAVEGPEDVERAHRARIEAKRLRYLLEPLRDEAPAAAGAVKAMKRLQDLMGELHDVHVLTARVAEGLADAASRAALAQHAALHASGELAARTAARRSEGPGLAALDRRLRVRRDALYAALADGWLRGGEHLVSLLEVVKDVAAGMERRTPARGTAASAVASPAQVP